MGVSAIVAGVGTAVAAAGTIGGMIGGGGESSGGGGASGTISNASALTEEQMRRAREYLEGSFWQARGDLKDSLSTAKGSVDSGLQLAKGDARAMLAQAEAQVAPWRTAGGYALNQISGLLGLPGYTALDPTKTLEGTPGYQFLRDQGTEALRRYGAGTGLLTSGAGMKGALDYGQKLAQTYAWAPYMSSLQNLSGQGFQASNAMGNWDTQTGLAMGGWDMQAGLATGGYDMQTGLALGGYDMQTGQGMAGLYSQGMVQQNQLAQQQAQLQQQEEYANNQQYNDMMTGLGYTTNKLSGALGKYDKTISGWFGGGGDSSGGSSGTSGLPAYSPSTSAYGSFGLGTTLMADGGPTSANRPYIIGEHGPELFVPNVPGYIIPNEYMRYSAFNQPYRRAA